MGTYNSTQAESTPDAKVCICQVCKRCRDTGEANCQDSYRQPLTWIKLGAMGTRNSTQAVSTPDVKEYLGTVYKKCRDTGKSNCQYS